MRMSDLIDRQAFIENERKLYCEDCDRRKGTKNGEPNVICYEIGEAPCRSCWFDDALTDLEDFPAASPWHRVEDKLPSEFQDVWAACKMNGRENWTIETTYDPYLSCPWGYNIPVLESGKAVVYAWMDRSAPEPPKEDQQDDYDPCYECGGYGDDYRFDEDGELVSNCPDCPFNEKEDA